MKPVLRTGAGERHRFALLPLCALLASLPFATLAQEAALQPVTVKASKAAVQPAAVSEVPADQIEANRTRTSDTAHLLSGLPGVSLYGAGGVSSLPSVHGLADDRLRIQVDGMDLISACGNHMNPPLSYIDPSRVGKVRLFAGVTPVSVGGDSIGATIQVESAPPEFAAAGQGKLLKGQAGTHYRSNGDGVGLNLSATYATEQMSLRYDGSTAKADDYKAGDVFKPAGAAATDKPTRWLPGDVVGSSSYKTTNHALAYALRNENHLVEMRLGLQDIPYQNYPNQRMDMTGNDSHQFNLRYQGNYAWGQLQARAYHEKTRHSMNYGEDKQYWYGPAGNVPGMPMDTEGKTTGVQVKGDVALSARDTLRVGAEAQRYGLDDWWLPSGGGMAPNTFWNIRDGERNRDALFAEWEGQLKPQWKGLLGARVERVTMDAGDVVGYNPAGGGNQGRDAALFNAAEHASADNNVDLTALARWTVSPTQTIEFGFAHKERSPNVYEKFPWSTWQMAALMNNFVGDGNGYVGNLALKPEKANTLSATFDWHAEDQRWGFKATPYVTRVSDYIDAVQWNAATNLPATTLAVDKFSVLKYVNQSARIYGLDLSGHLPLAQNAWGQWGLKGLLNLTRGKNLETGDGLIHIMPVNARLTLTQQQGGWRNSAELVMVGAKTHVSTMRNEIATPGYALVNLRGSYSWGDVRLDFGVENLFDRFYYLPTGGAYVGQGTTMSNPALPNYPQWGTAVPGMGRSFYVGMNLSF